MGSVIPAQVNAHHYSLTALFNNANLVITAYSYIISDVIIIRNIMRADYEKGPLYTFSHISIFQIATYIPTPSSKT